MKSAIALLLIAVAAGLLIGIGFVLLERRPFVASRSAGVTAARSGDSAAAPSAARATAADLFVCSVASVHDGDTLRCAGGTRIRLSAIAAREIDESCSPGHPCPDAGGAEARDGLRRLAGGKRLACLSDGSSYGRITAWCWRDDGTQINCAMIEAGLAVKWGRFDPTGRMCALPPG